ARFGVVGSGPERARRFHAKACGSDGYVAGEAGMHERNLVRKVWLQIYFWSVMPEVVVSGVRRDCDSGIDERSREKFLRDVRRRDSVQDGRSIAGADQRTRVPEVATGTVAAVCCSCL